MGNKIVIGQRNFLDQEILSGNCYIGDSLSGKNLTIDEFRFVATPKDVMRFAPKGASGMLTSDGNLFVLTSTGKPVDLVDYVYGTPAYYYHNSNLIGKFYLDNVTRIGKYQYEITCTSAIGMLDKSLHYGGIYTGTRFDSVLSGIIGATVPYTVDKAISIVPVYGWLPVASRRENLHQLLFSVGACIKKDVAGTIKITSITEDNQYTISDDRLFLGGSLDLEKPATKAVVTEHSYSALTSDELVTLYDGSVPSETVKSPNGTIYSGALVTFETPMHSLTISNGTIMERGMNYAVLAPSGGCTLTGKKYTHTTRAVEKSAPERARAASRAALMEVKDNIVRVENATLVTLANVNNVADRVLAFYSSAKTVTNDMVMGPERPGDAVVFNDPFDEKTEGFIQSQDISLGNTLRASAVFVTGYIPTGMGNFYNNVVILKGSGTWRVPDKIKKVHAVLISCGQRGLNGNAGGRGQQGGSSTLSDIMGKVYCRHPGTAGAGGSGASTGGAGGNIYEVEFEVTPGQTFSYSAGSGGSGQSTTFGKYSSANGAPRASGFAELFDGAVYGLKSDTPGKAGGKGTGAENTGDPYATIIQGDTVIGPDGTRYYPGSQGTGISYSGGGFGGGAAVGSNGYSGSNAIGGGAGTCGDGGGGATPPAPPTKTQIGYGGDGGHGGGGGGGNGDSRAYGGYGRPGSPGYGGGGGPGGLGGPGGIILYY